MKLVPPRVINCKSAAEKKVFSFLEQVSFSPYDVALHSLNIGKHEYKRWGEADFFVISKRGILLLEVKGGRVACKDGLWEFTNRYDETTTKKESPAAQASSAYFSLENEYLNKAFWKELGGVPRGWGVVFADIPRLTNERASPLPEHPDEITAYDVDCRGHNSFKAYLERAFDHWQSCQRSPRELAPETVARICQFLRPNFERVPSLNNQLRAFEEQSCQFTDEQYEKLDEISENDRIMVAGGAGTGKTFVAAACARYEAAAGRSVLLVTRSPFLASFLAGHEFPGEVTIATIDQVQDMGDRDKGWDTLIIDEGQDLCDPASLDLLDEVLEGGWESGRWRWFGDPNYQVSPSFPVDDTCLQYLQSLGFKQRLKQNVRNAGAVVEAIKTYSGADAGKARGLPGAGRVLVEAVESPGDIEVTVTRIIRGWLKGEDAASRGDIVVLVPADTDPGALAKELTARGTRAEPLSERALGKNPRDCVLVARIEDFKGLERPLACIAGLGSDPASYRSLAYKAISRANHELVLVATRAALGALSKASVDDAMASTEAAR